MDEKLSRPSVVISPYLGISSYSQHHHQKQHSCLEVIHERSTQSFSNVNAKRFHPTNQLNQIRGPTGSVRGHKDVVRKSLENLKLAALSNRRNFNSPQLISFINNPIRSILTAQQLNENRNKYLESLSKEEQDQCIAYVTTLGIIRRTFEDSKQMKSILNLNLIRFEERDIYLNQEYKNQLRMRCNSIKVPALFVDGQLVGDFNKLQGLKELELLNESGKLSLLLAKFKMSKASTDICMCCGSAKFITCPSCNGSGKLAIHRFKVALRCIRCDKNDGLVQCPVCSDLNERKDVIDWR